MAGDEITLRLKLLDEFSATLKKYQSELKGAERESAQASQKMSGGFLNIKNAVVALAGSAAIGAVVQGLRTVVSAAAEAEAAQSKLVASLRATGNYTDAAAKSVDAWSMAFLRATGVSDELAKTLVAEGLAMGKTVEQSQRLATAAANMAPVVGSVEGAFSLLIRASNGSMESLKRYGIQVTEAEMKTGDFEGVLRRVEKQFSGQAAAQLATYNGQLGLLKENFGNIAEAIGGKLLPEVNLWLSSINAMIEESGKLQRAMDVNVATASYMELAKSLHSVQDALENAEESRRVLMENSESWSSEEVQRLADLTGEVARLTARERELLGVMKDIQSKTGPGGVKDPNAMRGPGGVMPATKSDTEAAAKAAAEAHKQYADRLDTNYKNATEAIEENTQAIRENLLMEIKAANEAMALRKRWETPGEFTPRSDLYASQQADLQQRLTGGDAFGPFQQSIEEITAAYDKQIAALGEAGKIEQNTMRAKSEYVDADRRATEDAIKATKKRTMSDYEAAQAALGYANVLVGIVMAARSGNAGGVLTGIGSGLMMYGAQSGNGYVAAAGGALSILGPLVGNGQPKTRGGIARQDLNDLLRGAGLGQGGYRTKKDGLMSVEDFAASGAAGLYQSWANLLTGTVASGEKAARMLAGALDPLDLSFRENADAVAYLLTKTEDMTMAEAKLATARATIFSTQLLSFEDLRASADQWADAMDRIDAMQAMRKKVEEDLQRYRDARRTPGTGDDNAALAQLEKDRGEWIAMVRADIEEKRAWEEKLKADGLRESDVVSGVDKTNAILEDIRDALGGGGPQPGAYGFNNNGTPDNDGDKTNSEFSRRYARRRSGGGGGVTVIVNGVVGDTRDVAKRLHRDLKTLREFGEVSN